jgi:septum formation protein
MASRARLVLASSSPRRRELLAAAGYEFEVAEPPPEEEPAAPGASPESVALGRARSKARAVAASLREGIVIGADTIVNLDGRLIGKPADRADAARILGQLAGTTHRVVTGVVLVDAAGGAELARAVSTGVRMAGMSPSEIDEYVASGEADGKAGAYAIQETADRFVREVEGSFTNVVGLPTEALAEMLDEMREMLNG